tara:strand:- start:600 stop:977 length:378 start_codon:yes stop_codon:yes gene_type:complete
MKDGLISGADFDEAKEMYKNAVKTLTNVRSNSVELSRKMIRVLESVPNAGKTKSARRDVGYFYDQDDAFHGNLSVLSQDFANPANQAPGYQGAPGAGRSADEPMADLGESMSRGSLYRKKYFGRY